VFSGEEYAQWQSWGEGREKGEEGSGQLGFTTAPAIFTLGDGPLTHYDFQLQTIELAYICN